MYIFLWDDNARSGWLMLGICDTCMGTCCPPHGMYPSCDSVVLCAVAAVSTTFETALLKAGRSEFPGRHLAWKGTNENHTYTSAKGFVECLEWIRCDNKYTYDRIITIFKQVGLTTFWPTPCSTSRGMMLVVMSPAKSVLVEKSHSTYGTLMCVVFSG